jgi:hypothetical protein
MAAVYNANDVESEMSRCELLTFSKGISKWHKSGM